MIDGISEEEEEAEEENIVNALSLIVFDPLLMKRNHTIELRLQMLSKSLMVQKK